MTPPSFPRLPLFGAMGLIGFALIGATLGRVTHMATWTPTSTPISERILRFEDGPKGSVLVYDATRNPTDAGARPIAVETGQNGFLRGTLRGFDRTRHLSGVAEDSPFELTAYANGRLTLVDPATNRHTDLEAFGPTNMAVFAHFLIPPAPPTGPGRLAAAAPAVSLPR
jgi:putative photosynthetic complex assembly protein